MSHSEGDDRKLLSSDIPGKIDLLTLLVKDWLECMLRINRRTDYAVRVMLALAKHAGPTRLSTQQIQTEMLVPRAFLQRIIAELSRHRLVQTFTGPNGGLELGRPAHAISLRDVYEAIEGPLLISDCLEAANSCPLDQGCPVHRRWCKLQDLITGELESARLDQLAKEAHQLAAQRLVILSTV